MKTSEKNLNYDYFDSPYLVYINQNSQNNASGENKNMFGKKSESNLKYNIEEFNTSEMKLFNDLQVLEDSIKLINGCVNSKRKNDLVYDKIKVESLKIMKIQFLSDL